MKEVELMLKFNLMNDLLDNYRGHCYQCENMIEKLGNEYSKKDMLELVEYNLGMAEYKLNNKNKNEKI